MTKTVDINNNRQTFISRSIAMAKWIESTLAAMIWSWLMILLMMKKAVKEGHLGLADANRRRPVGSNLPRPGHLPLDRHGAGLRA